MDKKKIVVAEGDGIGPEIMGSTIDILRAADAPLDYEFITIGQAAYEKGITSGFPSEGWDAMLKSGVLLKAPVTTPQGKGFKSVNVTIRKTLNLFANVRPCKAYTPYVASMHPGMNLVIIRENEEDLYAGIEHRQTPEVTQVLKLITRPGSENIIRYAFAYARAYGRKKVTCMTKDNIMKLTDGLFHQVFDEIKQEYPEIETDHQIIDIGSARLATNPEVFDVIVTLNLYGDILSDITAQLAGSVGLAASANVGRHASMFEAIHGSAPDIAGKDVANPSGLLIAATQMLVHLGMGELGEKIKNAWLCTIEDGIHTPDIFREGLSKKEVGTKKFTEAVIERLGRTPNKLEAVKYTNKVISIPPPEKVVTEKVLVGIDVFIDWDESDRDPDVIGNGLIEASTGQLLLKLITNRGVKVFPDGIDETFKTDHWRCRFRMTGDSVTYEDVIELLASLNNAGFEVIKTENLYNFDGVHGYSMAQGE